MAGGQAQEHHDNAAPVQDQHGNNGPVVGPLGSSAAQAALEALPSLLTLPVLPHEQQLQALPELSCLPRLQKLLLAGNYTMRVLPACLSSVQQLRVLNASSCGLNFLTEELWECSALEELLLADNVLTEVPESVGRLQQLQVRCGCWWHAASCAA